MQITMIVPATILSMAAMANAKLYWPDMELPHITAGGRSLMEMSFAELPFAEGKDRHNAMVSDTAIVDGVTYNLEYNVLMRSGDEMGGGIFGAMLDKNGSPLMNDAGEPRISHGSDFSSLLPMGDKIYMITHFEAPMPSISYFSVLNQDAETGKLAVESTKHMDWSSYNGLWVPCAGSVTPWNTHFGSEEYEPNAREHATNDDFTAWSGSSAILEYMGVDINTATLEEAKAVYYPYMYGYNWEAKVGNDGELESVVKHFAMGRLAIELPYVMPDNKTVYITDDGTNRMIGAFKSKTAGDLSCGTLHAAKVTQTGLGDLMAGDFTVEWIQVGPEACDADVEAVAKSTLFTDIFDIAETPEEDDGTCPEGFTSINANDRNYHECLKLKEGMEMHASRFEFRRYSAMLGATTEFSKWEGITYDPTRARLYTAMSEVRYGMEDNMKKGEANTQYDLGGNNHVRVPYNKCGCVYYMDVDESTMLATTMKALVCGDQESGTDENNACNINNISQPDNLAYISGHDGLVIGEDTSAHQNDVMWYYDFKTESLTRFLSTPYGSETTSPYWYPNINGWAYLMAVIQHPYGETDQDKIDEPEATGVSNWVGYVGPFKAHSMAMEPVPAPMTPTPTAPSPVTPTPSTPSPVTPTPAPEPDTAAPEPESSTTTPAPSSANTVVVSAMVAAVPLVAYLFI